MYNDNMMRVYGGGGAVNLQVWKMTNRMGGLDKRRDRTKSRRRPVLNSFQPSDGVLQLLANR